MTPVGQQNETSTTFGNITHVDNQDGRGAKLGKHFDNCAHIYASGLGGACMFGAPLIFDGVEHNLWKGAAVLVGLLGAFLVVFPLIRERLRAANKELDVEAKLRSQLMVLSEYTLTPILLKLHAVLRFGRGTAGASNQANVYREAVLTAVREHVAPGNKKATANYFKYVKASGSTPAKLVSISSTARPPRTEFILDDSELGMALKDMLAKKRGWLCEDVDEDPPPGWDATKSRNYRTFISMTSQVGSEPEGMVTVDSDEPGELDESDLQLARMFATLIAIAENHSKP